METIDDDSASIQWHVILSYPPETPLSSLRVGSEDETSWMGYYMYYIQESKNTSIKMLKDVGMIVPKSRETSAVYSETPLKGHPSITDI